MVTVYEGPHGKSHDRQVEPTPELLAWADRVAAHVMARLPACFELDDLKQVARIAVWKNLAKYDPDNAKGVPVQGFLMSYVRNACLMSVRRRAWTEATAPRISPKQEAGVDIEASADASLKAKLVRWLIRERLTEQQQFCLLQFEEGVTTDKIAKRLGVPRPAVMASVEAAYARLRADLRDIGL